MTKEPSSRIVFMGTPEFSVPVLDRLCDGGFEVVGVVTQPDRPVGRKRQIEPPPVKVAAEARGIPIIQPDRIKEEQAIATLAAWRPDVLVTCAYGQILPKRVLSLATIGCLNVHASILPRWRGAAPIQRAVMSGDEETGVSIMRMVQALDAGAVYGTIAVPIGPDDDFGTVHDALSVAGADLLVELLPAYMQGDLVPVEQDEALVTYAHRIERQDEWIDWQGTCQSVHNHVRGLHPWPGAATRFKSESFKVWRTAMRPQTESLSTPGSVIAKDHAMWVACSDGWLQVLELQPAGKRRMRAEDWLRGIKDPVQFESGPADAGLAL